MTRTDESLLKQVAALEAYMDDLQRKVDDLCEYKTRTIALASEMKQVRSELKRQHQQVERCMAFGGVERLWG